MMLPFLHLLVVVMTTLPSFITGQVPPKTPVLSGFEPAAIGSYRELLCDAFQPGAGAITYKWYKYSTANGDENWESKGPIGTSQKYVFSSVTEEKAFLAQYPDTREPVSGKYRCRASNSGGTRDSEWGDLYVYAKCSLYTVSVSPAKPAIGSTFTLNCYIPNPSGFNVMWIKKADALSTTSEAATATSKSNCVTSDPRYGWSSCSPPRTFNLQVTNAQPADFAYWICKDISLSCDSNPVKPVVQAHPGTPQITGLPSGPVIAGTTLNLKCVASPSGDTYDWYKDGTKVTISLSYDVNVTKESAGVYNCTARNDVGSATSSDKTLVVYYKADSVVVSSGKTSSHAGETDRFTCTVTGGYPTPTLKIYFKRSGGRAVEVTQGQDRVMAKEDNQAEYYCEAKVPGYPALDMTSRWKTYNVTFRNTKVSFLNNSAHPTAAVPVGQVKKFTCETDESNPVTHIDWYQYPVGSSWRDITTGISSSERNGVYGGKIRISEWSVTTTKAMNGANVRCKSTYSLTGHDFTESTYAAMYVKFNPSKITMTQKPTTAVHEGKPFDIVCETDSSANPVVTITFHRKKVGGTWEQLTSGITSDVTAAEYNGMTRKSTLTVTANRSDTQAVFKCEVKDGSFHVEQTTSVNVYWPPTVTIPFTSSPVKEGDTLTLACTASGGNPTVFTYKWFYKNKDIPNETLKDYKISNIKYDQSGTYRCQAINYSPDGKADASLDIDIQYKAKWNPILPEVFTVASKPNTPMKFVLHVIANPSPTNVNWFFPNMTTIGGSFSAAEVNDTTYTLSKKSVVVNDYGNYTVNVTNAVGVSTFTFELEKAGPPDAPCCLARLNATAVSITLTFTSGFAGGSAQTFTIENGTSEGNAWEIAVKGIADPGFGINVTQKISELDSNTDYEFRVKATNADGDSGYGEILKAETDAKPDVAFKVERTDNQVTVSWPKLLKNYTRIQIKYCPEEGGGCDYHDVPDPTSLKSSFKLKGGGTYMCSMIIFDGKDQVFASPVVKVQAPGPNVGAIAGGVGGSLFILIIIAVVLGVVFVRKKKQAEKEVGKLKLSNNNGDANRGQVNPGFSDLNAGHYSDVTDGSKESLEMTSPSATTIQIENTGAEYAVVNKKGSKKPPVGEAYAEVDFKKKKGGKKGSAPPPPEGQAYADVDFSKKSKAKKGKDNAPVSSADSGDVYAEVNKPKKDVDEEDLYENVRKDEPMETGYRQPKKAYQVGVDGTIYSSVQILPPRNPDLIRGQEAIEEPYASVDFSRQAPPLPDTKDSKDIELL